MLNDSSSAKQGPDNAASRVANSARSIRTRSETPGAGTQGSASRQYSQDVARVILKVAGFHDDYGGLGIAAERV